MIDDDEPDIELLMAELRATMPPPTSDQIRTWADGTAAVVLSRISGSVTREDPSGGQNDGSGGWRFSVLDSSGEVIAAFSSDGTFIDSLGRTVRWSGFIEGSPASIGGSIASEYRRRARER